MLAPCFILMTKGNSDEGLRTFIGNQNRGNAGRGATVAMTIPWNDEISHQIGDFFVNARSWTYKSGQKLYLSYLIYVVFFCCPFFSTQFASELIDQEVHFEKAAELRREVMLFEAIFGSIWIQVGVGNVYFFWRKMFVTVKRWLHHCHGVMVHLGSKICRFCFQFPTFIEKTFVHQTISGIRGHNFDPKKGGRIFGVASWSLRYTSRAFSDVHWCPTEVLLLWWIRNPVKNHRLFFLLKP